MPAGEALIAIDLRRKLIVFSSSSESPFLKFFAIANAFSRFYMRLGRKPGSYKQI
jgi:hypothetical protein